MIKDLSACLLGQSLRVDCRYENKTSNPLTYEFSITKDNRKHVIHSTISVSENTYRSRANVTMHKNLVCLYLQSFTTSDEGVYMCELKATNDYTGNQIKNITVIKGEMGSLASVPLSHLLLGLAGPAERSTTSNGVPKLSLNPINVSKPFILQAEPSALLALPRLLNPVPLGLQLGHESQVSSHR